MLRQGFARSRREHTGGPGSPLRGQAQEEANVYSSSSFPHVLESCTRKFEDDADDEDEDEDEDDDVRKSSFSLSSPSRVTLTRRRHSLS